MNIAKAHTVPRIKSLQKSTITALQTVYEIIYIRFDLSITSNLLKIHKKWEIRIKDCGIYNTGGLCKNNRK